MREFACLSPIAALPAFRKCRETWRSRPVTLAMERESLQVSHPLQKAQGVRSEKILLRDSLTGANARRDPDRPFPDRGTSGFSEVPRNSALAPLTLAMECESLQLSHPLQKAQGVRSEKILLRDSLTGANARRDPDRLFPDRGTSGFSEVPRNSALAPLTLAMECESLQLSHPLQKAQGVRSEKILLREGPCSA